MMSAIGMPMSSPRRRSVSAVWLKSLLMLAAPVTSVSNPPLPSARVDDGVHLVDVVLGLGDEDPP